MIKEHVLEKEAPKAFSSKPKPGLMVKRQVEVKFKRSQINCLVDILKKAGEQELIGLWETYVKLIEEERTILQ
jgi:hypothetical protein